MGYAEHYNVRVPGQIPEGGHLYGQRRLRENGRYNYKRCQI